MKTVLLTLLTAAVLALAGTGLFVWGGWYDTSATTGHTAPVYRLLEVTMRRAVQARAADVAEPASRFEPAVQRRGAACYRDHCVQCHGGPGVAQLDIGKSLQPLPGPLVDAARRWRGREIYWITRHGIKMSGMPAWELRLSDADLWAVSGFVERLAELSPPAYRAAMEDAQPLPCLTASATQAGCAGAHCAPPTADLQPLQPRDLDAQARLALHQYACSACHRIPGLVGPETDVGPPLHGLGRRERIAGGRLPAGEEALVRWIRDPQGVDPSSAMPDMGVTEAHAQLMARYLLQQR
ncbi:c-type cytochrome [Azohydromonas caseinilytica]|uniref:Cytochrome C n=1 Tax=Azohydromonas caseinilytica TaxID=2728836 RepID=A0A848FB67_9BURK|nr:c-type cytochrome [Azohydromonas caseinilytica]NML16572.1 cytochrome C [Azohydromonas caseinilytica]